MLRSGDDRTLSLKASFSFILADDHYYLHYYYYYCPRIQLSRRHHKQKNHLIHMTSQEFMRLIGQWSAFPDVALCWAKSSCWDHNHCLELSLYLQWHSRVRYASASHRQSGLSYAFSINQNPVLSCQDLIFEHSYLIRRPFTFLFYCCDLSSF